jgi:magnesium and cobalt transporter
MPPEPSPATANDTSPARLSQPLRERLQKLLRQMLKSSLPRDELTEALEEHAEEGKVISPEERAILYKMLNARDMTVSDVMIPRSDIVAVDYHITMSELKEIIAREQHTRMPVYEGTLDTLKGFIHLKDLVPALTGDEPFDLDHVLREVYFVSPSMKIIDLLKQMRLSGHHLAIVVDEYGGTDGLVTLEDLFEALVGKIQDEHDMDDPSTVFKRVSSHQFELDAKIRMEELSDIITVDFRGLLDDEDYDTIGGFIFAYLHRVPITGETIDIPEIGTLQILEADPRRVCKVMLHLNFTPLAAVRPQ